MPNFAGLRRNIIVQLSLSDAFTANLEQSVGRARKTLRGLNQELAATATGAIGQGNTGALSQNSQQAIRRNTSAYSEYVAAVSLARKEQAAWVAESAYANAAMANQGKAVDLLAAKWRNLAAAMRDATNAQRGFYGGGAGGLIPGLPSGGGGSPGGGFAGGPPRALPPGSSGGSGGAAGYTVYRNDLERSLAKGFAQARNYPQSAPTRFSSSSEYIVIQKPQGQTLANIAVQQRTAAPRLLPAPASTPVHRPTGRPVEISSNRRGTPIYYVRNEAGNLQHVRRGDISYPSHRPTGSPVITRASSGGQSRHYVRDEGGRLQRVRASDISYGQQLVQIDTQKRRVQRDTIAAEKRSIQNSQRQQQIIVDNTRKVQREAEKQRLEEFRREQRLSRVSRRSGAEAQVDLRRRRIYSAPPSAAIDFDTENLNNLVRQRQELNNYAKEVEAAFRRTAALTPGSGRFQSNVKEIERILANPPSLVRGSYTPVAPIGTSPTQELRAFIQRAAPGGGQTAFYNEVAQNVFNDTKSVFTRLNKRTSDTGIYFSAKDLITEEIHRELTRREVARLPDQGGLVVGAANELSKRIRTLVASNYQELRSADLSAYPEIQRLIANYEKEIGRSGGGSGARPPLVPSRGVFRADDNYYLSRLLDEELFSKITQFQSERFSFLRGDVNASYNRLELSGPEYEKLRDLPEVRLSHLPDVREEITEIQVALNRGQRLQLKLIEGGFPQAEGEGKAERVPSQIEKFDRLVGNLESVDRGIDKAKGKIQESQVFILARTNAFGEFVGDPVERDAAQDTIEHNENVLRNLQNRRSALIQGIEEEEIVTRRAITKGEATLNRLRKEYQTIAQGEAYNVENVRLEQARLARTQEEIALLRPVLESGQISDELLGRVIQRRRLDVISQLHFGGGVVDLGVGIPGGSTGYGRDDVFRGKKLNELYPTEDLIREFRSIRLSEEGFSLTGPTEPSQFIKDFAQREIGLLQQIPIDLPREEIAERFPEIQRYEKARGAYFGQARLLDFTPEELIEQREEERRRYEETQRRTAEIRAARPPFEYAGRSPGLAVQPDAEGRLYGGDVQRASDLPRAQVSGNRLYDHLDNLQRTYIRTVEEIHALTGRFKSITGTEVEQRTGEAIAANLLSQTFDELIAPVSAGDLSETQGQLQRAAELATNLAVNAATREQEQKIYDEELAKLETQIAGASNVVPTKKARRGRFAAEEDVKQISAASVLRYDTPEKIRTQVQAQVGERFKLEGIVRPTAKDFQIGVSSLVTPEDAALLRRDPNFQRRLGTQGGRAVAAPAAAGESLASRREREAQRRLRETPKRISKEIRDAQTLIAQGAEISTRNQLREAFAGGDLAPTRTARRAGAEAQVDLSRRRAYSAPIQLSPQGEARLDRAIVDTLNELGVPPQRRSQTAAIRRLSTGVPAINNAAGEVAAIRRLGTTRPTGVFNRFGQFTGDTRIAQGLQAFHRSTGTPIALDREGFARARRPDGSLGYRVSAENITLDRSEISGTSPITRRGARASQVIDPVSGKALYSISAAEVSRLEQQEAALNQRSQRGAGRLSRDIRGEAAVARLRGLATQGTAVNTAALDARLDRAVSRLDRPLTRREALLSSGRGVASRISRLGRGFFNQPGIQDARFQASISGRNLLRGISRAPLRAGVGVDNFLTRISGGARSIPSRIGRGFNNLIASSVGISALRASAGSTTAYDRLTQALERGAQSGTEKGAIRGAESSRRRSIFRRGDPGEDGLGSAGGFGVNVPLYGGGVLLSALGGGPLSGALGGILQAAGSFGNPYLAAYALAQVGQSLRQIGEESNRLQGIDLAYRNITTNALGGTGTGEALLDQLRERFGSISTDSQLQEFTNRLLSIDAAGSIEEVINLAEIGLGLGKAFGRTPEESIQSFSLLLSNESIRRLDSFGISAIQVRGRIKELQEEIPDITRSEAFYISTTEASQTSLRKIGGARGIITEQQALSTSITQASETAISGIGELILSPFARAINNIIDPREQRARDYAQRLASDPYLQLQTEGIRSSVARDFVKILGPSFSPFDPAEDIVKIQNELFQAGFDDARLANETFPFPDSLRRQDFKPGFRDLSEEYNRRVSELRQTTDPELFISGGTDLLEILGGAHEGILGQYFTDAQQSAILDRETSLKFPFAIPFLPPFLFPPALETESIDITDPILGNIYEGLVQTQQLTQDSSKALNNAQALSVFTSNEEVLALLPSISEDIDVLSGSRGFINEVIGGGYVNEAIIGEFQRREGIAAELSEKIGKLQILAEESGTSLFSPEIFSIAQQYVASEQDFLDQQKPSFIGEDALPRPEKIPIFSLLASTESAPLREAGIKEGAIDLGESFGVGLSDISKLLPPGTEKLPDLLARRTQFIAQYDGEVRALQSLQTQINTIQSSFLDLGSANNLGSAEEIQFQLEGLFNLTEEQRANALLSNEGFEKFLRDQRRPRNALGYLGATYQPGFSKDFDAFARLNEIGVDPRTAYNIQEGGLADRYLKSLSDLDFASRFIDPTAGAKIGFDFQSVLSDAVDEDGVVTDQRALAQAVFTQQIRTNRLLKDRDGLDALAGAIPFDAFPDVSKPIVDNILSKRLAESGEIDLFRKAIDEDGLISPLGPLLSIDFRSGLTEPFEVPAQYSSSLIVPEEDRPLFRKILGSFTLGKEGKEDETRKQNEALVGVAASYFPELTDETKNLSNTISEIATREGGTGIKSVDNFVRNLDASIATTAAVSELEERRVTELIAPARQGLAPFDPTDPGGPRATLTYSSSEIQQRANALGQFSEIFAKIGTDPNLTGSKAATFSINIAEKAAELSDLYSETALVVNRFEAGRANAAALYGLTDGGSAQQLTDILLENKGLDTEARKAFFREAGDAYGISSPQSRFQTEPGGAYDRAFEYIRQEGGDEAAGYFTGLFTELVNVRQSNIGGPPSEEYLERLLPFVLEQQGYEIPGITDKPISRRGRVGGRTHIAEAGDTFSALALEYGLSVDELRRLNPGTDDRAIQIGQRIFTGGEAPRFDRFGELGPVPGAPFVEPGIDTDLDVPDTSVAQTELAGLVGDAENAFELIQQISQTAVEIEVRGAEELEAASGYAATLAAIAGSTHTLTLKTVYETEGQPPRSNLVGKVGGVGLGGGSGFRAEQG